MNKTQRNPDKEKAIFMVQADSKQPVPLLRCAFQVDITQGYAEVVMH